MKDCGLYPVPRRRDPLPADPFAEALLVDDGVIAWIGADDTADGLAARADRVIDLDGALVAPGFVDAHVHLFEVGLALAGVDLSASAGVTTLAAALDAVAKAAAGAHEDDVVLAYGWDERSWPEGRPRRATSSTPRRAAARCTRPAWTCTPRWCRRRSRAAARSSRGRVGRVGLGRGEAHHVARDVARAVSPARRTELYRTALRAAAEQGVVSVHEMSARTSTRAPGCGDPRAHGGRGVGPAARRGVPGRAVRHGRRRARAPRGRARPRGHRGRPQRRRVDRVAHRRDAAAVPGRPGPR